MATKTIKKRWNNDKNVKFDFTDGTSATMRPNQFDIQEGQAYDLTIAEKEYNGRTYYNITECKPLGGSPSGGGNPDREKLIVRQVALKCATDLVCAGKVEYSALAATVDLLEGIVNPAEYNPFEDQ